MKFIIGTKEEMTQYFDGAGRAFAATVVKAAPMTVTRVKDGGKDGYKAVQVGVGAQKESRVGKAAAGQTKGLGTFKMLKEMRLEGDESFERGGTIDVSAFKQGDTVSVTGITKGKGFQGVVKRHGFGGGRRTHGQKHSEREAGSIGATWPQRVIKGKRMAGRMGADKVTVKNLSVLEVDPEAGLMLVSGALPGRRGTVLLIKGN